MVWGVILVSIIAPIALGQDGQDNISQLVAKVDPSVVMISIGNESLGSGFVIDPSGVIATNYHVIEGAKEASVIFPANKDKTSYKVEGFVAILPAKDFALIRIRSGDKPFPHLSLAENEPAKGERVFAFGSPLGLSGSVSDGIVSAVRSGSELREIFLKMARHDVFKDAMGYDLDSQWLQITAPISPGNSGGPLVNTRGEVVGINTWIFGGGMGQNLNFSLSAANLRQYIAGAGTNVLPLSDLPPPQKNRRDRMTAGDPEKTFTMWKSLNVLKNELNAKLDVCEKKFEKIPPPDPLNSMRGQNTRFKKLAEVYAQTSKAYEDYASRTKALNNLEADPDLVAFTIIEADFGQRFSDACQEYSKSLARQSDRTAFFAEFELEMLKKKSAELRTANEVLRLKLSDKYHKMFPTLEQTAKSTEENRGDYNSEKKDSNEDEKAKVSTGLEVQWSPTDIGNRSSVRTWTDRSGQHQIQAKFLGIEDGKVKLEKTDGKIILVPIKSLSEADQRFIGALN